MTGALAVVESMAVVESIAVAESIATNNFGDTRSGGLAGPMGLLIILVLIGSTILLIRNMNARLRRLPDRFPLDPAGPPKESPESEQKRPATSDGSPLGVHRSDDST